jgi:hypothetical protein
MMEAMASTVSRLTAKRIELMSSYNWRPGERRVRGMCGNEMGGLDDKAALSLSVRRNRRLI